MQTTIRAGLYAVPGVCWGQYAHDNVGYAPLRWRYNYYNDKPGVICSGSMPVGPMFSGYVGGEMAYCSAGMMEVYGDKFLMTMAPVNPWEDYDTIYRDGIRSGSLPV